MFPVKQELINLIEITEADIADGIPRAENYTEYHRELCEIVLDILYRAELPQHQIEVIGHDLKDKVCPIYLKHVAPKHRSQKDQQELNQMLLERLQIILAEFDGEAKMLKMG